MFAEPKRSSRPILVPNGWIPQPCPKHLLVET
jgi:hypothetical protein